MGLLRAMPRGGASALGLPAATARSLATTADGGAAAADSRDRSRLGVGEAIANAEDGLDVPRRPRVGLELAADVLDVGIDRPLIDSKATPCTASRSCERVKTRPG